MFKEDADFFLDVTGLRCPEPLMIIRRKMRELSADQTLFILADDPATTRDVPNLCFHLGYTLLEHSSDAPYTFLVKK